MTPDQLIQKISEIYCCVDGPPRAYFELPFGRIGKEPTELIRVIYTSSSVAMLGSADVIGPILCSWLHAKLDSFLTDELKEDRAIILFWRSKPVLAEFTDHDGRVCTQLRCRLSIPGIDLMPIATPEGAFPRWL